MPYITVRTAKTLDEKCKTNYSLEMGKTISVLPGKTIDVTIVVIEDGCTIYKSGEPFDGVFIEVRLYKQSPEDAKKDYTEILFKITEDILNIPPERTCISYLELPSWGINGQYLP